MQIVIPTSGRANWSLQHTLHQLVGAGLPVTLVVQHDQYGAYADMLAASGAQDVSLERLPHDIKTISPTRDFIVHEMGLGGQYVVMLDDDLDFAVRRDDDPTKFRQPTPTDIKLMMQMICMRLKTYPHVSIGAREGGNRVTELFVKNTRMMRVLAYDRHYMIQNHVYFAPMEVMEDFHVALQIMRQGKDCLTCNEWVSNQFSGSGAAGGCSVFRTPEIQSRNAHRLAALHPGFVKVVEKPAWDGKGNRLDVVVQWKRARASAPEYTA